MIIENSPQDLLIKRLSKTWEDKKGPQSWIISSPDGFGKNVIINKIVKNISGYNLTENHPDHIIIENINEDGKIEKIKIDSIRKLTSHLKLTSIRGRRIAVIKGAQDLTVNAANALLKTLEEPPKDALIILITNSIGRLPATIRSRCAIERCPAPTEEEQLKRQPPESQSDDWKKALILSSYNPGIAQKFIENDGLNLYQKIIDTIGRSKPFERKGIHTLSNDLAKNWELTKILIPNLIYRSRINIEEEAVKGEKRVTQLLLQHAQEEGLHQAWDITRKIIQDTDQSYLDQNYACQRLVLAIEFTIKQTKQKQAQMNKTS